MSGQEVQHQKRIRVLVSKLGLDGHDRGALVICRALRDAGMEVIYSGLFCTPDQVAKIAIDEDVDAVAMSLLNGAHLVLFPKVARLLKENGINDILLVGGGIIPDDDKKLRSRNYAVNYNQSHFRKCKKLAIEKKLINSFWLE
jgi:methylmalonyl-CoA mutase, C-terminal domain